MGWRYTGTWVRLMTNYFFDDAILRVGPQAEVLFLRSVAFCGGTGSDGFVSAGQLPVVGIGLEAVEDLAARLVEAGLWVPDADRGGWDVRQWLKYNRSTDEIAKGRSRDAAAKRSRRSSPSTPKDVVGMSAPTSLRVVGMSDHQDRTESPVPEGTGQDSPAVSGRDAVAGLRAELAERSRRATARRMSGSG